MTISLHSTLKTISLHSTLKTISLHSALKTYSFSQEAQSISLGFYESQASPILLNFVHKELLTLDTILLLSQEVLYSIFTWASCGHRLCTFFRLIIQVVFICDPCKSNLFFYKEEIIYSVHFSMYPHLRNINYSLVVWRLWHGGQNTW